MTPSPFLALAAASLVVGCAASLDSAQTTELERQSTLQAEAAYSNLVRSMRTCYFGPATRVEADYMTGTRQGDVKLIWFNSVGVIEWARIRIEPTSSGSKVVIRFRVSQSEFGPALDAWLQGKAAPCPYA